MGDGRGGEARELELELGGRKEMGKRINGETYLVSSVDLHVSGFEKSSDGVGVVVYTV